MAVARRDTVQHADSDARLRIGLPNPGLNWIVRPRPIGVRTVVRQ